MSPLDFGECRHFVFAECVGEVSCRNSCKLDDLAKSCKGFQRDYEKICEEFNIIPYNERDDSIDAPIRKESQEYNKEEDVIEPLIFETDAIKIFLDKEDLNNSMKAVIDANRSWTINHYQVTDFYSLSRIQVYYMKYGELENLLLYLASRQPDEHLYHLFFTLKNDYIYKLSTSDPYSNYSLRDLIQLGVPININQIDYTAHHNLLAPDIKVGYCLDKLVDDTGTNDANTSTWSLHHLVDYIVFKTIPLTKTKGVKDIPIITENLPRIAEDEDDYILLFLAKDFDENGVWSGHYKHEMGRYIGCIDDNHPVFVNKENQIITETVVAWTGLPSLYLPDVKETEEE